MDTLRTRKRFFQIDAILIAIIVGSIVTAIFITFAYIVAKRQADHGLLDKVPANTFPAFIDTTTISGELASEAIQASQWWNNKLGFVALTTFPTDGIQILFDVVHLEQKDNEDFYMRMKYVENKNVVQILINTDIIALNSENKSERIFRSFCHEYGHVFGLAHDEDISSVMYPNTSDKDFIVTDKDINLIIERIGVTHGVD